MIFECIKACTLSFLNIERAKESMPDCHETREGIKVKKGKQ